MTTAPNWLKVKSPDQEKLETMKKLLDSLGLNTICRSAKCPNAGECFEKDTATFLILGPNCTRNCQFCAVEHGKLNTPDINEPTNLAQAVEKLGLKYVVITSVTRDDLADYGAEQFAESIRAIKEYSSDVLVEVLIPDLQGDKKALTKILKAKPDVVGHNLETVPRLYSKARPEAVYNRSLNVLKNIKRISPKIITKTSLILGLGETEQEIIKVFHDLKKVDCDILTLGQYLQPTTKQLDIDRYVTPEEFNLYRKKALELGIKEVYAEPLVRSSYHAHNVFKKIDN
ncbi:lipoyl synthase [Natroniella acetigena]|uniref:lipoyl synthase n=1 Tax=Natroniella acetigena TaxID=52004 RepID=UPI00200B9C83|nr:lipoyl synthase [Natroniella acetigena]MCK8827063.1 lipoyl synthase [Natroniella acetigena]